MKALFIKIIPYVTVLLAMLAWAFGSVLYKETLIAWWEPLSMALILAIATLFLYKNWQWLTRSNSKILNGICHLFHVSALCYFLILGGNLILADPSSTRESNRTLKTYRNTQANP